RFVWNRRRQIEDFQSRVGPTRCPSASGTCSARLLQALCRLYFSPGISKAPPALVHIGKHIMAERRHPRLGAVSKTAARPLLGAVEIAGLQQRLREIEVTGAECRLDLDHFAEVRDRLA